MNGHIRELPGLLEVLVENALCFLSSALRSQALAQPQQAEPIGRVLCQVLSVRLLGLDRLVGFEQHVAESMPHRLQQPCWLHNKQLLCMHH